MKKRFRNLSALALVGAMALGTTCMTAYAYDKTVKLDTASNFAESPGALGTGDKIVAGDGVTSFNLIKDYDSFDNTDAAPKSNSPADTFEYTITPYAVWNAGNTTNSNTTPITVTNMPMLTAKAVTGMAVDNDTDNRNLVIKQDVSKSSAIYGESSDRHETKGVQSLVTLPNYVTVGDYWYKVEETHGTTTGVLYGTNSNPTSGQTANTTDLNGNYSRVYYIHVQVTETYPENSAGTPSLVRNVTMHTSAPDSGITNQVYNNSVGNYYVEGNKVNAIENQYYAGELVITKEVTGNAGDKNEFFPVTVTFTKPANTVVNSDITLNGAYFLNNGTYAIPTQDVTMYGQYYTGAASYKWSVGANNTEEATTSISFYVKDGTTVTFSNIPYGINYTVKEALSATDTYQHMFVFDNEDTNNQFDGATLTADKAITSTLHKAADCLSSDAVGSITDANDTITITNDKVNSIDIGVLVSNAPYAALLAVAGAAGAVAVRRRRNRVEE